MKTLATILTVSVMFISTPTFAAEQCKDTVNVKVSGLVCDFCARALEKVFGKREEVSGIKVDLDKGDIRINLKPGKTLDDETVKQLVTDSGYNVTAINKGC